MGHTCWIELDDNPIHDRPGHVTSCGDDALSLVRPRTPTDRTPRATSTSLRQGWHLRSIHLCSRCGSVYRGKGVCTSCFPLRHPLRQECLQQIDLRRQPFLRRHVARLSQMAACRCAQCVLDPVRAVQQAAWHDDPNPDP